MWMKGIPTPHCVLFIHSLIYSFIQETFIEVLGNGNTIIHEELPLSEEA